MRWFTLALLAPVAIATAQASAAVIAEYSTGYTAVTTPVTVSAANVVATPLSGGAHTTLANQNSNHYSQMPWLAVSQMNTASPSDRSTFYVQFTVTPVAGYELDLTSFTFDGARGGDSGPRSFAIYTSVDGLSLGSNLSDIASGPDVTSGSFTTARGSSSALIVLPTYTADLSAERFQNLTDPFTVRVYFATPTNSQNIDTDNFILNGTVSAVPEPASLAVIAVGGALMLRRRRHA